MTMLIVSMLVVTPAMACAPGSPCGSNSTAGDAVKLAGAEKDKFVGMALANNNVKELDKELVAHEFVQADSEALEITVQDENGASSKTVLVAWEYKNEATQEIKTLVYSYDTGTGNSTVVLLSGSLSSCVYNLLICLGTAAGCAIICAPLLAPDPAQLVEVRLCLACLPVSIGACGLAYDACYDYYFG